MAIRMRPESKCRFPALLIFMCAKEFVHLHLLQPLVARPVCEWAPTAPRRA